MRRQRVILSILCAIALVAGACSSGEGASDEIVTTTSVAESSTTAVSDTTPIADTSVSPTTEADGQNALLGELAVFDDPDPLDLTYELTAELSGVALISPDGGTAAVTDADGTTYTLSIPEGALLTEEEISMTPVSSVEGLPFDGSVLGVYLEPEGLVLLRSAQLTVVLSPDHDVSNVVAFGTFANGKDFHLTPSAAEGSVITTTVDHFSLRLINFGGDELARDMAAQYEPTSNKAVFDERMALIDQQYAIDPADHAEARGQFLELWATHSVVPSLLAAGIGDDTDMISAWIESQSWKRAVEEYEEDTGDTERFASQIAAVEALVRQAFLRRILDSYDLCIAGDIDQGARMIMWILIASDSGISVSDGNIADIWGGCLRFRFTGFSLFEGPDYHAAGSIETILELRDDTIIRANTAVMHDGFSFEGGTGCVYSTTNGAVEINLDLTANLNYENAGFLAPKIHIRFVDRPKEHVECGTSALELELWYSHFIAAREKIGEIPVIRLDIVKDGDLYAAANFTGSVPLLTSVTESSGFQLIHMPLGG